VQLPASASLSLKQKLGFVLKIELRPHLLRIRADVRQALSNAVVLFARRSRSHQSDFEKAADRFGSAMTKRRNGPVCALGSCSNVWCASAFAI
jgi:hypothetical protein